MVKKSKNWTKEEDNILMELYENESNKLIAILLNRTVDSIKKRGKILGLHKSEKRLKESRLLNLSKANKNIKGDVYESK